MSVFDRYARYYDAVYADKDYAAECDVIEHVVDSERGPGPWRMLDAGCGTGRHAIELARRGHEVTGVDRSASMLAVAERGPGVRYRHGDLRDLELGETFDAALCLFAVLSYQLTDGDVAASFRSLRRHLDAGGVLVCDCWHAPAVLTIGPTARVKHGQSGRCRVVRTATPRGVDEAARTNTTRYTVQVFDAGGRLVDEIVEDHTVRFFDPGEVEGCAAVAGFEVVQTFADWKPSVPLHDRAWTAVIVACAT